MNLSFQSLVVRGAAALSCFGLFFSLALSPAGASLVTGRTAYWKFDETSGVTTAANSGSAGSTLDGSLVGGASNIDFATGLFGNAVWLGGSSSADPSVDVASAVIAGSQTAYTISLWFNPGDIKTSDARRQVFIETYDGSSYGISAGLIAGNNRVHHYTRTGSGNTTLTATTAVTPPQDEWHHLAITFGGSTSKIYINGIERAEGQIVSVTSVPATTDFRIGRHRTTPGTSFNGLIDDMAIWDGRTLTGYEVHAIHRMGQAGYALDSDMTVHVKANNTTNLNQAGSWESGGAPGASSYLVFDTTFAQADALDTGGALSVAGLRVTSGTNLISINNTSANYLQIGAAGVDMTTAARDLTVANLRLGADQSWDIATGRTLTVGSLSGNHALTKTGGGTLAITGAGSPIGGTTVSGGTLQIGNSDFTSPGSLTTTSLDASASGAVFNLYAGTVTIDGGPLKLPSGDYVLEPGGTDTAVINLQDGAEMEVDGVLRFQVGSTLNVTDSTVTVGDYIGIGSRNSKSGTGKMVVDGASATVTTDDRLFVGGNGSTGRVTVRNGGSIDIATSLDLADSGVGNTKGYVVVESGGSISVGTDIDIGVRNVVGQDAELTITGTGSTLTQSGTGSVTVGGATNSTGRLIVKDGGSMTVGSGGVTINDRAALELGDTALTGTGGTLTTPSLVNIDGRLSLYKGTLTIDGGLFTPDQTGDFHVGSGGLEDTMVVRLNNGASSAIPGELRFNAGSTLELNNSTATVGGNIIVGSGTAGTGKILVDGANASLTGSGIVGVGGNAQTGYLTVSDQGQVILNGGGKFGVADSVASNSKGYVTVESGGSISVGGDVYIGSADKSGQVGRLTVTGAGSSFQKTGTGATTIGGTSNSDGEVVIAEGGSMSMAGDGITINPRGTLTIGKSDFTGPGSLTTTSLDAGASGATFNLYAGTVTIDGGDFKPTSGNYILEPGGTDTAVINLLNGAEMEVVGLLRLQVGSTLNVTDSTAHVTGFIGVGSRNSKSGTGKMVVDGTNAEVTTDSYMWVGGGGATGRVTVRNGGSLNVAQYLAMADSGASSTKAYIDVESGGSITVGTGDILIGTRGLSGQVAQMTLSGSGSAITQNGAGALRIGTASGSTGLLTISEGTFTTGTGGTVIGATGTLNLQGGTLTTPSLDDSHGKLSFTGGRLEVKDFTGSLLNDGGVYSPGLSPAVSSITGDYSQEASGTIEMELGGTVLGSEYDHLDIFGDATLNGTLRVVLIDSFEPAAGNTFDLFDYHGGVFGDFAVYDLPTLAGANIWWDHSLVSTTGILRVVPEPTTAVMVLFGVLMALVSRRRRAA